MRGKTHRKRGRRNAKIVTKKSDVQRTFVRKNADLAKKTTHVRYKVTLWRSVTVLPARCEAKSIEKGDSTMLRLTKKDGVQRTFVKKKADLAKKKHYPRPFVIKRLCGHP